MSEPMTYMEIMNDLTKQVDEYFIKNVRYPNTIALSERTVFTLRCYLGNSAYYKNKDTNNEEYVYGLKIERIEPEIIGDYIHVIFRK